MGAGTMTDTIPPPPPGYVLQPPDAAASIPPPPAGYVMQQGKSSADASTPSNAGELSNEFYAATAAGDTARALKAMNALLALGGHLTEPTPDQMTAIKTNPTNGMSGAQLFMSGVGKSIYDTGRGIGQLVGKESQGDIDSAARTDAPLMATTAGKLGDIAGQAGQMLIPVGDATKALSFAGKAAPYVGAALRGGAFAGAQPVEEGQNRAVNAVEGAALGVGGQAVSAGASGLAKGAASAISPIKQAAMDVAQKYGIPLHLSQVTDSKALKTLASAAKYLPFAGNKAAADAQQGAFNRALSNQIGQNSNSLTDEVLSNAAKKIGAGYDALFGRNTVNLNAQDAAKLTNIINSASKLAGKDVGDIVSNHVDEIVGNLDQGGSMPGRLYQAIRTDQLLPAEKSANPALGYYLRQVRSVLQGAANRSMGPQDTAELAKLNGQYNSLKVLQKAVTKRAAGAGGDVAPSNLWSLVNGRYGSTSDMRDLSKLGQTVLKDPIPDSGTAQRLISYGALTGGAAMPHTVLAPAVAGATIGRILNSPMAARAIPAASRLGTLALSRAARPAPKLLPLLSTQPAVVPINPQFMGAIATPQK